MISDIGWQRQVDSFREHTWRLHHMACLSVCMACHVSCIACHTDMRCLLSQHTATYCNTLRHIASHVIPTCDVSCIPCHAVCIALHVSAPTSCLQPSVSFIKYQDATLNRPEFAPRWIIFVESRISETSMDYIEKVFAAHLKSKIGGFGKCIDWTLVYNQTIIWESGYSEKCHDTLSHLTAIHCNTLQHIATHCDILQHTATCCNTLRRNATHCDTLQHTATYCNTLRHLATHCDLLQHTATCCYALFCGREVGI